MFCNGVHFPRMLHYGGGGLSHIHHWLSLTTGPCARRGATIGPFLTPAHNTQWSSARRRPWPQLFALLAGSPVPANEGNEPFCLPDPPKQPLLPSLIAAPTRHKSLHLLWVTGKGMTEEEKSMQVHLAVIPFLWPLILSTGGSNQSPIIRHSNDVEGIVAWFMWHSFFFNGAFPVFSIIRCFKCSNIQLT